MKVLFIARKLPPQTKIYALHNYIKCFVENGNCASYISDRQFPINITLNQNTNLNYKSKLGMLMISINNMKTLINTVLSFKPEIVHVEQTIAFPFIFGLVKVANPKSKVFLDIRTLPNTRLKTMYYILITKVFRNVVALNESILKTLKSKNKFIIPLGYDPTVFYPLDNFTPESNGRVTIKKIVYFGAISKNRNICDLVSQLTNTFLSNRMIALYIIGNGDGLNELNHFIEKNKLKHNVKVIESMPQKKLAQHIREADLCLSWIPNDAMHNPNIPLKTVESMASGTPVLATYTKGNREIICNNQNSFIASEEKYADRLLSLIQNGYQIEVIENCKKSVAELTWSNLYKNHLFPYYKHLINQE